MTSTREMLVEMATLNGDHAELPIPLKRMINNSFKSNVCYSISIKPPVIVAICCRYIFGCQSCVDKRYTGADQITKFCTLCKAKRGCNETMILRSLVEFLEIIKKAYSTDKTAESPAQHMTEVAE